MRDVPASIDAAWKNGIFIGERRAVARVTVQHPTMKLRNYSLTSSYTEIAGKVTAKTTTPTVTYDVDKGSKVNQTYADFMFTTMGKPLELPNIKSVSWTRSIDSDLAECTIEVWNTAELEVGEEPRDDELDVPGFYTYSRGGSSFSAKWMQERNEWFGMLAPDNIIRTYEGYGYDPDLPVEKDPHLVQSGTWIIDSVTMSASGNMSIKCRDIGRILLDQQFFDPVVPKRFAEEGFANWTGIYERSPAAGKLKVKARDSSNTSWIGGASVAGHKLEYAFDGDPNTYWLSIGNDKPSRRFAYEWVECSVAKQTVTQVKIRAKKKGYTCYVSVKVGGVWQGKSTINYHEDGIGHNGADIKYVKSVPVSDEKEFTVSFKAIKKVEAVRVTFGNLQDFGNIGTYHYRAGIRQVHVYNTTAGDDRNAKEGPAGANPGRYSDYTDIVKLLMAWGGFLWPKGARQRTTDATGTYVDVSPDDYDWRVLGKGVKARVWGEFMDTGTSGPSPLGKDEFMKKSLLECIGVIRDIVGFLFFIDEEGGGVWRFPNIQNRGCQRSSISKNPGYVPEFAHQIDEKSVLLSLDCTIDSKNVRESVFVGDGLGKIGAYVPGFNPNPTGLRRFVGWTDTNFGLGTDGKGRHAEAECELMADLISLRQLFTYRTDQIRIPANPAIQIDDQVRIFERVTAEGYLHYVKSISSSLDCTSGQWTYDLQTHWLGQDPKARWVFRTGQLKEGTQAFVSDMEKVRQTQKQYERLLKDAH